MHRFQSFMAGRYGPDSLSKATSVFACVLLIPSLFLGGMASNVLWLLALVCLALTYFRMFSRNIEKRRAENRKYCQLISPLTRKYHQLVEKHRQKKLYRFFKCPSCGTVLRVPKGKGHIRITCKTCKHIFEENS